MPEPAPPPKPVPEPTPSGLPKATRPEPQTDALRREAWLLKQSPQAYTLQVIGLSNAQAIIDFTRQHRFRDPVFYVETQRAGQPWFSLLHGLYPNRDAAVAALASLPEAVRAGGAWPRSVGVLQEEIRKRPR
jgi:DamX protein